ncbi:transposase [Arthrobacter castelli]|uniref:transposase n=1 Tax=Arthrobacter castelli TaxID=271431 RepID=UPI00041334C8
MPRILSRAEDYTRRNVVERSFNVHKQWRGLANRYDILALTYCGGTVLHNARIAAILDE